MKPNVPIIIPDKVWQQVQNLCREISGQEWSGILFYKTEGTFGAADFKCILEYIYLMDIGDHSSTNYEFNEDVAWLMMTKQGLFDCKIGHIHSHHNMEVWFSGVDQMELQVNSEYHNFYLSVIVNNRSHVTAKIAFRATQHSSTSQKLSYRKDNGEWTEKIVNSNETHRQTLCIYDCTPQGPDRDLDDIFVQRLEKIKLSSPHFRGSTNPINEREDSMGWDYQRKDDAANHTTGLSDPFLPSLFSPGIEETISSKEPATGYTVENFIACLLQDNPIPTETLPGILRAISARRCKAIGKSIQKNAPAFYEHCFPNDPGLLAFGATMEECREILEEYISQYPVAAKLISFFELELVN